MIRYHPGSPKLDFEARDMPIFGHDNACHLCVNVCQEAEHGYRMLEINIGIGY